MVEKIQSYYGRLPVRLVLGSNTFTANEAFITNSVKTGEHFEENSKFMKYLHSELVRSSSCDTSDDSRRSRSKKKRKDKKKSSRDISRRYRSRSRRRSSRSERRSSSRSDVSVSPSHHRDPKRRKVEGGQRRSRSSRSGEMEKTLNTTAILEDEEDSDCIQILEENSPARERTRSLEADSLKQIEEERDLYLDRPNNHPEYGRMWENFWYKKNEEFSVRGIDISSVDLTSEWRQVWKKFIEDETERKISARRPELASISRSEDVTLSESDSEASVSPEEVNVLSLLQLLAKLSVSLLLSLQEKISRMKETALNMEGDSYGSSQLLIDDEECFNLLDQAAETLKLKLDNKEVAEEDSTVVKITLQQISVFMRKSSCQRSDILEIDTAASGPAQQRDNSRVLRMSIAKTIQKDLQTRGRRVSQLELDSLVEAEYMRVKYKIPHNKGNLLDASYPSSSISDSPSRSSTSSATNSSQSDLFSVYNTNNSQTSQPHIDIDWGNVMKGINHINRSAKAPGVQAHQHGGGRAQADPTSGGQGGVQTYQQQGGAAGVHQHRGGVFHSNPPRFMTTTTHTFPNHNTQRPRKSSSDNEMLSDSDLASLMNNYDHLKPDERNQLKACLGELETLDPRKIERMKKILLQRR